MRGTTQHVNFQIFKVGFLPHSYVHHLLHVTCAPRAMYSNPPSHGVRIVHTVLSNPELYQEWKECIKVLLFNIFWILLLHLRNCTCTSTCTFSYTYTYICTSTCTFSYTYTYTYTS